MERIAGLREYVAWKQYRSALGLPDQGTEEYRMLAQGRTTGITCLPILSPAESWCSA